jgi:thiol-disulfide isomerase/thioredoxin
MVFTRLLLTGALVALFGATPGVRAQPTDFDARMTEADVLLARREYADALRTYKDANALQGKKSAKALLGIARAHQALTAHKDAVKASTDALKYAGGDVSIEADARSVRGISLFAQADRDNDKRWKQAEEDFRAVVATSGTDPIAQYNLGVTLLKQRRDEEGIQELHGFLERAGKRPEAVTARTFIGNPRYAREPVAPDFTFTTLTGDVLRSEDLKGKVVLLDFWATWCPPCVKATPGLARLQKKLQDEPFTIVGVSADRQPGLWKTFIESNALNWPQYLDNGRKLAERFGVEGYPTYLLIDHEGFVRYRQQGWSPSVDHRIEREARKLLKHARTAPQ